MRGISKIAKNIPANNSHLKVHCAYPSLASQLHMAMYMYFLSPLQVLPSDQLLKSHGRTLHKRTTVVVLIKVHMYIICTYMYMYMYVHVCTMYMYMHVL